MVILNEVSNPGEGAGGQWEMGGNSVICIISPPTSSHLIVFFLSYTEIKIIFSQEDVI